MKNGPYFSVLLVSFLFAACSPSVVTRKVTPQPPLPTDSVQVFNIGETVPNSSEMIGFVAVVNDGFAKKCPYDSIIHLAKKKTAEKGGNGLLLVDHLKASKRNGSIDQIGGLMIRTHDMHLDTLAPNPVMEALTALKERREKLRLPRHIIEVNGGAGWLTSKVETPYGTYKRKSGSNWRMEYNYLFPNGFGFGLTYAGSQTSFPEEDLKQTYIGPSFALRLKLSKQWMLKYNFGIGYCQYNDGYSKDSGVGIDYSWGLEYMLSKHVGIGVGANYNTQYYSKPDGYDLGKDERYGLRRIALDGGLRFYF